MKQIKEREVGDKFWNENKNETEKTKTWNKLKSERGREG